MLRFLLRRVWQSMIVLFIVTIMVFFTLQALPGDPVMIYLGPSASNEQIEYYTEKFGFDQPAATQYVKWVKGILQGEMGRSFSYQRDIKEMLIERIKVTLSLTLPALAISSIVGISLGVWAAIKRGSFIDSLIISITNIGVATPGFWIALLGIYIFGVNLGWLPIMGYVPLNEDFVAGVKKLILPVFILSIGPTVSFARQTRSAVLEVIKQDYVRTARSKGLRERFVITKHILRNAFIPILTLLGMSIGRLLGGTIVIEQIFIIPGIGTMMMQGILNRDFMVVQNIILVITIGVLLSNLLVDFLYGFVDPRIRYE